MKALIYKELKLAMHPLCYVFIAAFPFMILIPSYPIAIGFIYILSCYPVLFLGANKGQQSNDLLFSTLLPIRKKDIVFARILTVLMMQIAFILIMSALLPLAIFNFKNINSSITDSSQQLVVPGLGHNSFVLLIAIALIGFTLADLIFFPIYYKKGKSIVKSTLLTIIGFAIYICGVTIGLPFVPGMGWMTSLNLGIQFAILGGTLVLYAIGHYLVYRISAKRLERVDF